MKWLLQASTMLLLCGSMYAAEPSILGERLGTQDLIRFSFTVDKRTGNRLFEGANLVVEQNQAIIPLAYTLDEKKGVCQGSFCLSPALAAKSIVFLSWANDSLHDGVSGTSIRLKDIKIDKGK